ncbi:MAG: TM2 domain-containing protein [Actinomycetota bacterium]|nr:TM2 domain-containing protein [Actinomycetota bacterium]
MQEYQQLVQPVQKPIKQKKKWVAWVLWATLGLFGAHRYYLGDITMGVIYTFTVGLGSIGWLIDATRINRRVDIINARGY